jgi:predicted nucleic acid-binding protein
VSKEAKVLIDTDVFILDLRYPRDSRYTQNKAFLERVEQGELVGWTTVYNLMEVCGILSFNLSSQSLQELFIGFASRFNVTVLFPDDGRQGEVCFAPAEILDMMKRKLSFGDALVAQVAQRHRKHFGFFVTWNAAHFQDKLSLRVATPAQL